MRRVIDIQCASTLTTDVDSLWRAVSTMQGVNFELHPFVHMTSPAKHRALPATAEPGHVVFTSWLLLFHVLPFDRHALGFQRIDAGAGFVEESRSWLQRRWRHERILTADGAERCSVVDRLVIEPRLAPFGPVVRFLVSHLFDHRHRRLRRRFGSIAD